MTPKRRERGFRSRARTARWTVRAVALAAVVAGSFVAAAPAPASHDNSRVRVQLTPESATNTAGTEHCVTARVRDTGHGNANVVGATVRFSVSGANTASGSGVTGADGRTTFCYTGTRTGNDVITAFVDFNLNGTMDTGEPSSTASKTWVAGPPASLLLDPLAAQNTTGTQHCVTATVRDVLGNPASGVRVIFSVTGVNPRPATTLTTSTTGQATFCYVGTNAGGDTISAFADTNRNGVLNAGEPTGTATKAWTPPGPSTLTLSPAADDNPAGVEHCVTATATNSLGNPSAGIPIVFTVTGANSAGGTVTTNAAGQATFCYTGTNVGLDTIRAFADTNRNGSQDALEPFAVATKLYTPAAPATLTLEPPTSTNIVGEQHCVLATVRDAFGNPTPDVSVIFAVSGANFAGGARTTDENGQATFCYTGTRAGLDTISAFADTNGDELQSAGEPTGAATKLYHPGAPATLVLTPPTATNRAGEEHCVTATVRDAFGNANPDVAVVFSVSGANSAGGTATTDDDGEAVFCYTGTRAGQDAITAFADTNGNGTQDAGEPAGAATKTYTAAAPATVVLTPPTATNRAGERHCVTATVRDAFGNPNPDVAVVFSVSGANSAGGTVTTDEDGEAVFCYTGTRAGEDTITAFADTNGNGTRDTGEPEGVATKIYTPADPAELELTPETATNEAGEEHCVTATVSDRFGNRTPGIVVRFSVTGANPQPSTVRTTDANGQAIFCYTGTRAGTDTISAFADTDADGTQDESEPGDTARKTYTPGPPATVILSPPTATNVVDTEHCVTADVSDRFENPNPGVTVHFTVSGAVNTTGQATTDADGEATFCYQGPPLPGEDAITAFADTDGDGEQDAGEPAGAATKTWVLPPSSPLCTVEFSTYGGHITADNGDRASFGGNARVSETLVPSGEEQYRDHGPATPMTVHSINVLAVVCTTIEGGRKAQIYGQARIDGAGSFFYRITVKDMGEPGTSDTYSILLSNGYYSGEHVLEGGNVRIHQAG